MVQWLGLLCEPYAKIQTEAFDEREIEIMWTILAYPSNSTIEVSWAASPARDWGISVWNWRIVCGV